MFFSIIKLMMIKVLTKIPLVGSLVKLKARQIYIVDSVEQCEQITTTIEK